MPADHRAFPFWGFNLGTGVHWNLRARFFLQQKQALGCSRLLRRGGTRDLLRAHYQRQYARVFAKRNVDESPRATLALSATLTRARLSKKKRSMADPDRPLRRGGRKVIPGLAGWLPRSSARVS